MMKSDYKFEDEEVKNFYYQVATKRPSEANKGKGGVYFRKNTKNEDILHGEDGLHILYYYEQAFEEKGLLKQANILKRVINGSRLEIIRTRKVIFIPNLQKGEILSKGKVSKKFRTLLNCFESVLAGKPNVTARYFFA